MTNIFGTKDPNANAVFELDARSLAYRVMRRDHPYTEGVVVKAPRHTGWYYEATSTGTKETKHNWPDLPRAEGETVLDGSVQWTARAPDSAGLPTISGVTWSIDPQGSLSIPSETIVGGFVYPNTTGGTAGVGYAVTARITWSTGQVDEFTGTIQVEQQ